MHSSPLFTVCALSGPRTPLSLMRLVWTRVLPLLVAVNVAAVCPTSIRGQPVSSTSLLNNQPVLGRLPSSSTAYYRFVSVAAQPPYQQPQALFALSAFSGSPSLYVSLTDPVPSPTSFDYAADWLTGNVVSVSTQPPYTAYVAVVSSTLSSSNYTVLVTAYDAVDPPNTLIPLLSARPQSSATAAGGYRYFAYNVTHPSNVTTVALTETYGQCWLLLNAPNSTQLPTLLHADYYSDSATFPLVALLQPADGVWTIGVWSNQTSAFSIMAVDHTQTQPMEVGSTYPGWVQSSSYNFYSVFLDAGLLATAVSGRLELVLLTLSGDADLYCSYATTRPVSGTTRWYSSNPALEPDRLSLDDEQLQAGNLYCGVSGYGDSTYTFLAVFSSAIVLTSGQSVSIQSVAGGSQLYSMVFPAADVLIVLAVVADVGSTELYIGAYGQPPSPSLYKVMAGEGTEQLQQLYTSTLCGYRNVDSIPGSSPPLCQLQVVVVTPSSAIYRVAATTSGQPLTLTPGLPMKGAAIAGQPAYFSFRIPHDLSNATLQVSVTNGASGVSLQVGVVKWTGITLLWSVAQQPNSNQLSFQLDWTNPTLPGARRVTDDYVAVLSTASNSATFNLVYILTDIDAGIIELLDGVPQASLDPDSIYEFYYFAPPVEGWSYAVTVSLTWQRGWGALQMEVTNGPQAFLLGQRVLALGQGVFTIWPDSAVICNPRVNSTCGYSFSMRRTLPYCAYTITVTTSR